MQEQNRNLALAIGLSIVVMLGYQFLLPKRTASPPPPAATSPAAPIVAQSPAARIERTEVLAEAPRIPIDTPRLKGSISLAGGRIDDLVLADYYETTERSKQVTLLSPAGSPAPYYVETGWTTEGGVAAPGAQTVWTRVGNNSLTPDAPVVMTWDNGAGLTFERSISIDRSYLFTIRQKVTNHGAAPVTLRDFGSIVRLNPPITTEAFGPAPSIGGVFEGALEEVSYKDLADKSVIQHQAQNGWVSMNDKYWLVAVVPPRDEGVAATLRDSKFENSNRYSVDFQGTARALKPNEAVETSTLVFAGAKEQDLLDGYESGNGIDKLGRTVDFGWLYLLARPFYISLAFIAQHVGNFGVAILIFNVILKLFLFPLQDRSFHQMARMRDIQPKIAALKEKFGDDREKMASAQMELFKKEKINPASGCLPLLIQIPIFFALYRVLITTIVMRHAPFVGWIHDLSAPDPTTLFNLFGLIPWTPPGFLMVGVWPLLYGLTMFLQQKMTPTPITDPMQARIMNLMPVVLVFVFTGFPAGLMIYYAWNNVLTIGQMYLIRKRFEFKQAKLAAKAKD